MATRENCPVTSNPNPVKAIRLKCLDCSGGSKSEAENCIIPDCPLWPFRMGKNPFRTVTPRELSEEQRMELRERFQENVLAKRKQRSLQGV